MNLTGYFHLVLVTHIIHFWVIVSVAVNLFTSLNPLLTCSPSKVVASWATTSLEMDNWLLLKLPMVIADNCTRDILSLIFKLRVIISFTMKLSELLNPLFSCCSMHWSCTSCTTISLAILRPLLELSVFLADYRDHTGLSNVLTNQWIVIRISMLLTPSIDPSFSSDSSIRATLICAIWSVVPAFMRVW